MNKLLFRAVFFCLSVLSLSSCRQDDETDRSNESVDLVAVNIPIEGVRVESADSPLTRAGSVNTLTVTEELEDGFVLETSLMPVSAGLMRAAITTGLASDVQILAIAYRKNGTLYKCQYFTPGSPVIHLPKGERFKLVFYSYNNTTKPDISGDVTGSVDHVTNGALFSKNAFLNDKSEIHTNNVMWGRIDLTPVITSGITLPGVAFTHLFSRLDWQLRSVVGTITECSGSIENTYENGTIKLGNLVNVSGGSNGNDTWVGVGSADYATSVKFATSNSMDITSSKTVFCPNAGENICLGLENIVVGGKTFTNKSYAFSTKLKRGFDYHVVSTIKRKMTIVFSSGEGGFVSPSGPLSTDAFGDRLSSLATANSGWRFEGWYKKMTTGDVQVGNNWENVLLNGSHITVIMHERTEGIVYEARFVRSTPSVTFTSGVGGSVTPSGLQEGSMGGQVASTASPNSNRVFDGWYRLDPSGAVKLNGGTGDEVVNNNRLTVTLNERTAGKTYEARFVIPAKSSLIGDVRNCTNVKVIGYGRWVIADDAVSGEITKTIARLSNVKIIGDKFYKGANNTVFIKAGRYRVKFEGSFNRGLPNLAGAAVYLIDVEKYYYRSGWGKQNAMTGCAAYFVWHNGGNNYLKNAFTHWSPVDIAVNDVEIHLDAQIVGQNRPAYWTTGSYTITRIQIEEL